MGDVMIPRTQAQADIAARDEWWRSEYAKAQQALAVLEGDYEVLAKKYWDEHKRAAALEQRCQGIARHLDQALADLAAFEFRVARNRVAMARREALDGDSA